MTEPTVRLSLRDAFDAADSELALSEESVEPDSSTESVEDPAQVEQLTVETPAESGLFDTLSEEEGLLEQPPQGDSYEVTVDGETFLVGIDDLRGGYMRQADYTRKTQELKELQREAEKAIALMRMLEERPAETLRKLYQRINAGQPLDFEDQISSHNVEQPKSPIDIEALVEARVAEALANDPRLVAVQQERALGEIYTIFSQIEEDYGVKLTDSDKQLVLEEAQKRQSTDLPFVFGALYSQKLQAERKREAEKRNAKAVSPTVATGRFDSHPIPAAPKKYTNFKSALLEEMALDQDA